MTFTLTKDERRTLESYKSHCEYTIEYLDDVLGLDEIEEDNAELDYIYRDNVQGIELKSDWNTMHNEIREMKALYERFQKWYSELAT